jgi:hypothetical protein
LTLACAAHGYGQTMYSLDFSDILAAMKYSNFAVFCNGVAMALLKVGIGMSLLRIKLSRVFNIIIILAIVVSLLVNLTVFGGSFAACTPMEKNWNKDPTLEGTCWPRLASLVLSYTQTGRYPHRRHGWVVADNHQRVTSPRTCYFRLALWYICPRSRFPITINGRCEGYFSSA